MKTKRQETIDAALNMPRDLEMLKKENEALESKNKLLEEANNIISDKNKKTSETFKVAYNLGYETAINDITQMQKNLIKNRRIKYESR